eukprot:gene12365-19125_t
MVLPVFFGSVFRFLSTSGDDGVQVMRKKAYSLLLIPLSAALFGVAVGLVTQSHDALFLGCGVYASATAIFLLHAACSKRVTDANVSLVLGSAAVAILLTDYVGAANHDFRCWGSLIVLLNMALVCHAPRATSAGLVAVGVLWLLAVHVEDATRYGFFDVEGVSPSLEDRVRYCDCETPPCKKEFFRSVVEFCVNCIVYVLAYVVSRTFSHWHMLEERDRLTSAFASARRATELLVQFDLVTARACLVREEEDLPPDFAAVLWQLLANLEQYELFIPQSCRRERKTPDSVSQASNENSDKHDSEHLRFDSTRDSVLSSAFPSPRKVDSSNTRKLRMSEGSDLKRSMPWAVNTCLAKKSVTVSVYNLRNSLSLLTDVATGFEKLQQKFLSFALSAVDTAKGIVEGFMGDRITASWNASRKCISHSCQALHAAVRVAICMSENGNVMHSGIAAGDAFCGNAGTENLLRYNIIGSVFCLAHDLERVAKEWNITVIIDSLVCKDVNSAFRTRVVLERVVHVKTSRLPLILWEVLGLNTGVGVEWMYAVESAAMRQATLGNQLGVAYLTGKNDVVAKLLEEAAAVGEEKEDTFFAYLIRNVQEPLPSATRFPTHMS